MPALIRITDGLAFVSATIYANSQSLQLDQLLLDTGSSGTVLKTDHLITLGIVPLPTDRLRFVRGVGGDETVLEKAIDALEIGHLRAAPFTVQMGAMDYGILMDGIIGIDFLLQTQAVIELKALQIYRSP